MSSSATSKQPLPRLFPATSTLKMRQGANPVVKAHLRSAPAVPALTGPAPCLKMLRRGRSKEMIDPRHRRNEGRSTSEPAYERPNNPVSGARISSYDWPSFGEKVNGAVTPGHVPPPVVHENTTAKVGSCYRSPGIPPKPPARKPAAGKPHAAPGIPVIVVLTKPGGTNVPASNHLVAGSVIRLLAIASQASE